METLETTQVNTAPITFTDGAIHELHKLGESLNITADQGLRIGVKGGGCSGMSYLLAFDHKEEGDQVYDVDGIKVFMNKSHLMYVIGMQVDYENGLNSRGFTFSNPNAKSTCGCGTSFSA